MRNVLERELVRRRHAFCRTLGGALLATAALSPAAFAVAHADDAAETERAKALLTQIQAGALDRSALAGRLNGDLTEPILARMTAEIASLGTPLRFGLRYAADNGGTTSYVFRVRWQHAVLDYTFGVDDATDKIAVLYFRPGPPE